MCGIVGYVGNQDAEPVLLEGLRRLEYRGYDSAGLVSLAVEKQQAQLHLRKKTGRIANLAKLCREQPAPGFTGISHTRWATHGPANDRNAHPHTSNNGLIALVHNGVIENYATLRRQLISEGITFHSDTDTEVVAQLMGQFLERAQAANASLSTQDFLDAFRRTLGMLKGTYGLAVVSPLFPGMILGARLGSPLVLGVGEGENLLASDPSAIINKTSRVVYLHDHQL